MLAYSDNSSPAGGPPIVSLGPLSCHQHPSFSSSLFLHRVPKDAPLFLSQTRAMDSPTLRTRDSPPTPLGPLYNLVAYVVCVIFDSPSTTIQDCVP